MWTVWLGALSVLWLMGKCYSALGVCCVWLLGECYSALCVLDGRVFQCPEVGP